MEELRKNYSKAIKELEVDPNCEDYELLEIKSRVEQAELLKKLMLADAEFMDLILGIMDLPPNVQLAIQDLVQACNE